MIIELWIPAHELGFVLFLSFSLVEANSLLFYETFGAVLYIFSFF